jgi:prepilin-type N-terminal cleavage/methylation domain-containing protein
MHGASTRGYTLVEILVVLTIVGIGLALATLVFDGYLGRAAARNAARVFRQDLTVARTFAARTRRPTVIRFAPDSVAYRVETSTGTVLVSREYGGAGDLRLSGLDLDQDGDSLAFDRTGGALLTTSHQGLGRAVFMTTADTVEVYFNAMGASRLEEVR